LPIRDASSHDAEMELVPVAVTSVLVAVAGPLGITLGWWLGRRGERERQQRDERKSAYVDFVHAAIRYRNATDAERHDIHQERWVALAEIVLVAPPGVVRAASYHVTTGDRLLTPDLSAEDRQSILRELWEGNRAFTRLARIDLRVGAADPWDELQPVVGERISFERPPDPE
jgi:hypothetical protein